MVMGTSSNPLLFPPWPTKKNDQCYISIASINTMPFLFNLQLKIQSEEKKKTKNIYTVMDLD